MKLLVLSDLHVQNASFTVPLTEADVVILAGGILPSSVSAVQWARQQEAFQTVKAVVYVPGVLEHWGAFPHSALEQMCEAAQGSNVHPLDRGELVISGVRFLGCTLWTDFSLKVKTENGFSSNPQRAKKLEQECMNQRWKAPRGEAHFIQDGIGKPLPLVEMSVWEHRASVSWLEEKLAEPFQGKTVVISHHAPHRNSVPPTLIDSWNAPSAANDLPEKFFSVPELWAHGNTSSNVLYQIKQCLVFSNARSQGTDRINQDFDPNRGVKI